MPGRTGVSSVRRRSALASRSRAAVTAMTSVPSAQSGHGHSRRTTELFLLCIAAVPVVLLYAMYLIDSSAPVTVESLGVPLGLFAAFAAAHVAVRFLAPGADPAIMPIVFVLSGVGITFLTRLAPEEAVSQVVWLFLSVAAMVAVLALVRDLDTLADYKYTIGLAGVVLLVLPMILGTERNGSKLWTYIGSFSFQPGEFAKILITLFLAFYLATNREALSASMRRVGPLRLPRLRMLLPMLVMWGISLLVVVFERDLGSALLFFAFFVIMLYVATGRVSYVVVSLALLAAGGTACYFLFSHVANRVNIWIDPWSAASTGGYQIVQSLYSLADGGLSGVGIGNRALHDHPLRAERLHLLGHRRGNGPSRRLRRPHPVPSLLRSRARHGGAGKVRLLRLCRRRPHLRNLVPGVHHRRRRHQAPAAHGRHPALHEPGRHVASRQLS